MKLLVTADPEGTKLFDNATFSRLVGRDGVLVKFNLGHHVLTFTHEGFAELRKEVDFTAASKPPVHAVLKPTRNPLRVKGTPHTRVLLNHLAVGEVPFERELDVGSHHLLTVDKKGFEPASTPIVIPTDEPLVLTLNLTPLPRLTPAAHAYRASGRSSLPAAPRSSPHRVAKRFHWPFGFGHHR